MAVELWTRQASDTLEEARRLCTQALELIQSTAFVLLTQLPAKLRFARKMVDMMNLEQDKLARMVDLAKSKAAGMPETSAKLRASLEHLESVLLQLQYTKVPAFLIDSNVPKDSYTLEDFILLENIEAIRSNIGIYLLNEAKLRGAVDKLLEALVADQRAVVKTFTRLGAQLEEVQVRVKLEVNPLVNTVTKENTSLENELASLLAMLTNHYDQCVQAESHPGADLEVLRQDVEELPEVLKELHTVVDVILNNESKAVHAVDPCIPALEAITSQCRDELANYNALKLRLAEALVLALAAHEYLSENSVDAEGVPVVEYCETISQLVFHYTKFIEIYRTVYLSELHYEKYAYPRRFLTRLSKFLNEELQQMQKEEHARRKEWLAKYGDFIPREFVLPGEHTQPSVVQVITEGLDEVDQPTTDDEVMLLRLLESTK